MVKSDYREERLALYRSINAKNKRRGKQMEQRVMKELGGNRVPMSGSGSIKGDGIITHNRLGYILVECKMSAAVNTAGKSKILVDFRWFDKMEIEAKIMNARFPILVIHHLDAKQDYVFIHNTYFNKYFKRCEETIKVNTGDRNSYPVIQKDIEVALIRYTDCIELETNRGVYMILTLQHFKELLLHE